MFIDANFMLGGEYMLPHAVTEESARQTLEYFGISRAVVYHAEAKYYDEIAGNRRLVEFTKANPDFIPCLVLSPFYKSQAGGYDDFMQMAAENGVKFVRIFPSVHGYAFESGLTDIFFALTEELGAAIMLDMDETYTVNGYPGRYFERMCKRHPNLPVILTCCSHRRNYSFEYYLEHCKNVYIETSVINNWLFYEDTVGRYGSERLLWGSLTPFNNAGCSVTMLAYADIPDKDKERIAFKNIMELRGL